VEYCIGYNPVFAVYIAYTEGGPVKKWPPL
jgi:hypothetical protein